MYQDPRTISIQQVAQYLSNVTKTHIIGLQRVMDQLILVKPDMETEIILNTFASLKQQLSEALNKLEKGEKNV